MSNPLVSRNPTSMANPSTLPSSDILRRSSFDFIRSTSNSTTVALRPAILAALIGQKGLGSSINGSRSAVSLAKGDHQL